MEESSLYFDKIGIIVAILSLIFTSASSIIAGASLYFMRKINKTTSEFAKRQAQKQNKYNKKQLKATKEIRKAITEISGDKKPKSQEIRKIEDIIGKKKENE